jgi:hypothetical protein
MRHLSTLVVVLSLVALAGCGRPAGEPAAQPQGTSPDQATAQQPAEPAVQPAEPAQAPAAQAQQPAPQAQQPAAASRPAGAPKAAAPAAAQPSTRPTGATAALPDQPAAPAAPASAAPAKPKPIVVASGTKLPVRLAQALNSGKNKAGDKFEAVLDQDLAVEGLTVAPRGSVLVGKLVSVEGSGRVEGLARMSLTLTEIRIGGESHPIDTDTLSFQAESTVKQDATKIGVGAGIGAAIGAIAGGGKGAAIGAATGGGAGTAVVLATKGKEVAFAAEQKLTFTLKQDLAVTIK